MKLKILIISPNFNSGGAERIAIKLGNGMSCIGHDVHFIVINGIGPLKSELLDQMVMHDLKIKRVRNSCYRLVKLINKLQPDIVFSSINRLNSILLFSKPFLNNDIKIVIREPNTPSINLQNLSMPWLYKLVYKYLYKIADKVVAQSKYMQADLVNNFSVPKAVIQHIYNPVSFDSDSTVDIASLSTEKNKVIFVGCGRLDKQKGFDIFLHAIALLEDHSNLKFFIIGEGAWRNKLEQLAIKLKVDNCVEFLGYRSNTQQYFLNADVVFSSSRWEGLPNVVLESIAVGTPVLATDCPGGTSEIIETGINGWLVGADDAAALSKGIQQAADEYKDFDSNVIKHSILNFSNEIIFDQYNKLFLGLVMKKN